MKSTVMQGTDVMRSLMPGTGKAQGHFYVIPVEKAQPEFGPKETWTDPDRGTCSGVKGLYPLKLSGVCMRRKDWGTAPV